MTPFGALPADLADPGVQLAAAALGLVLVLLLAIWRAAGRSARAAEPLARQLDRVSRRMADLGVAQDRLAGGLIQVTEAQAIGQSQTQAALERRLQEVTAAMGESLHGSAARTARSLGELRARLETIDRAQGRIEKLSGDVLGLQDILTNKQARGAFGELQLADLVRDALPPDSYGFQVTLGNGRRVDCLIRLPAPPGPIAVDSKFPLEPWRALQAAASDRARAEAARSFRAAIRAHVRAIAERYIVAGETADSALMFVPSEAVYATLHADFPDLVREGFAARVWLVSPTTCMATLTTLRAVLKDVRVREQADLIRRELGLLHADVTRLAGHAERLRGQFGQAQQAVEALGTVAGAVRRRAGELERLDFGDGAGTAPGAPAAVALDAPAAGAEVRRGSGEGAAVVRREAEAAGDMRGEADGGPVRCNGTDRTAPVRHDDDAGERGGCGGAGAVCASAEDAAARSGDCADPAILRSGG